MVWLKNQKRKNKFQRARQFTVGQMVWLRNQTRKNKFSALWLGLYEITRIKISVNVITKNLREVYHKNMLKPTT